MNVKPNEIITEDNIPLFKYTEFNDDIQPFINYLDELSKQKNYIKIVSALKKHNDLIANYYKDTIQLQKDMEEVAECFYKFKDAYLNKIDRYDSDIDSDDCYDNIFVIEESIEYDDDKVDERNETIISILHYCRAASNLLEDKSIIYKIPFKYENIVKAYFGIEDTEENSIFYYEVYINTYYEERIKDNKDIKTNIERLIKQCNKSKELIEKYRLSFPEYLNNKIFDDIYNYALEYIEKYSNLDSLNILDNNTSLFNKVKKLFVSNDKDTKEEEIDGK